MLLRRLCVHLQCCLVGLFYIQVIQSVQSHPSEPEVKDTEQLDDADLMPEEHDVGNYVGVSDPSEPVTWRTRFKVKAVCEDKMVVGVTVLVWTPEIRVFQHVWRCYGDLDSRVLHVRNVAVPLDDDIVFRPSFFNKKPVIVDMAKVVVWMLEEIRWAGLKPEEKREAHKWSAVRESRMLTIPPPYSRTYKPRPRRACVPWYWPVYHTPRFSDVGVCSVQQTTVTLLDYPIALNGQTYGVTRHVSNYTDLDLERHRIGSLQFPQFTVELWVYILEYCPLYRTNAARACLLFGHMTLEDAHVTPVLLVDDSGRLQVEAAGPGMYSARKTHTSIPRLQWVRILFSLNRRLWTLEWSYGVNHNETTRVVESFDSDPYFDETSWHFVVGGAEGRLGSIHGYMGRVKLYRGRVLTLQQLSLPSPTDPMFTAVDSGQMETECADFKRWFQDTAQYYLTKQASKRTMYECPNSYKQLITRTEEENTILACPRRPPPSSKGNKPAAHFLRSAAARYRHVTSAEEAIIAKQLLDFVESAIEENGLSRAHELVTMVTQGACLGDGDALFTLAAFLNNGVGTTLQQEKSVSLLLRGVLNRHRLSIMAMGHHHAMGLDGLPFDQDVAYTYYKDVGDKTREDRDNHPEHQVATETIRLMDEKRLEQQTDESGDLFMWLQHQAKQGVASAQTHLAHLYFWGSQGMQRNLQAARDLFMQGAEQGDTDSQYNLAMMDIYGRGGAKKNETAGKELLTKAASKKNPYAISAMGWLALEKERNYTKAAALFEQALSMNIPDAAYYLAHMHQFGIYPGLPKDADKALSLYEWAATRGHNVAGLLYAQMNTKGTPKRKHNKRQAMEWSRYIAEQNADIGKLLRKGVNAYRDGNIPLSAYYYLLASEAGAEVGSFNMAWLCEERKEDVAAAIGRECVWRHFNLTVQREAQFVDAYSYIKMGDYFWYGCQGVRNVTMAADYYAAAGRKNEPHALFNLAFMVEEGADISRSVWRSLKLKGYYNNFTLLMELYDRCRESYKSEAFVPCTLALYRVWLLKLWTSYRVYLLTSSFLGGVVAVIGTAYFCLHWFSRLRHRHPSLYRM